MTKKIMSLLLIAVMVISGSSVVFASSGNDNADYKDTVFDYILDDYLLVTDLDPAEAEAIYGEVKDNGLDEAATAEAQAVIYDGETNATYEETVLYIQENYDDVTDGITAAEKELVDKYFLGYALQYYVDYGSATDFEETSADYSRSAPMEPIFFDNDEFEEMFVDENEISLEEIGGNARSSTTKVAAVRIFADPTRSTIGSSGLEIDLGTHAWITVSNISDSTITVGKFKVAAGKTMALGTWGNKSEHKGLWYNLESYLIKNNSAYSTRYSLKVEISSSSLSTLNTHVIGYDKWSYTTNCSSFAVTSWNKVCSTKLSAGVVNTPKNLANSIQGVSSYSTGVSVPNHYKVYYANGSGSPSLSNVYN